MSCITTWLLVVVVVVIIVLATSNAFVTTHRRPFHPPPSFLLERQQQQQQQNIPLPPHPLSRSNLRNLNNNGNGSSSSNNSNAVEDVKRRQLLTFTASLAAATGVVWNDPRPANAESTGRMTDKNGPIIVPPLDDRKYETFELPGNGLRVLLCSDPSLSMAAAAMDVHVGATSDPDAVPGLAHFTEHMLFLGTELYPEEGGFEAFLAGNGGFSNAFTSTEDTVYYFDISAGADSTGSFSEALRRFGSFFACPLFTQTATGRELNAIESENSKNLQSDSFRMYQIDKSRVNKDHPFSKFFTGNKATLLDGTKKQGIDLRNELLQFYEKYYSANQMTLAIVGPEPLTKLKKYVEDGFSSIPNRQAISPETQWRNVPPYMEGKSIIPSLKHKVEIVPVNDARQVILSWPIVYNQEKEREWQYLKPDNYVSHLIGHEGEGSILSFFKSRGWANGLGASLDKDSSGFSRYEVIISLTKSGLDAVDDVCEAVFSYIDMISRVGVPDYIFDEVLQLDELEWRFLEKGDPSSYVQSLVEGMQKYPPSLYVSGPRRVSVNLDNSIWDNTSRPRSSFENDEQRKVTKDATFDLFSKLTVENSMMTIFSKSFEGKTDKEEKWYGTSYRAYPYSPSNLIKWSSCRSAASLGMFLPRPNQFIPTERGLQAKRSVDRKLLSKPLSFNDRVTPIKPPQIIGGGKENDRWTVYFKQDDRYGQPKAYLIFELLTPDAYSTSKAAVLAQLYDLCLSDSLGEYSYDAVLAGLTYNLQVLPRGVRLTFGGYNEKIVAFMNYVSDKVVTNFRDVLPKNADELERFKDTVSRELAAFDTKQPYSHSIFYSALSTQPFRFQYSNSEMREALESITLEDLFEFVQSLWSRGQGEALVQGNLEKKEALRIIDAFDKAIPFNTISDDDVPPYLTPLPLPLCSSISKLVNIRISEPNVNNKNSASQVMFQCLGTSEKDHVLIELLSSIINEPFYDDLRTNQQLGYIVSCGAKAVGKTRNLSFVVQSSIAKAEKLTDSILTFVSFVKTKYLEKVSDNDVAVNAKALFVRKTTRPKTLADETTRNWGEIITGERRFDRAQREAAVLLDITKEDLILFWDNYFTPGGPGCRILVSETIPTSGPASSTKPPKSTGFNPEKINDYGSIMLGTDDINTFRSYLESTKPDTVDGTLWIS